MGQGADPDINGLHIDRELTASGPVVGWVYSTTRSGFAAVSPRVISKVDVDDIRDAAVDGYSDWSSLLSSSFGAVWTWLQADATAVAAYQTGRGIATTQAQVLEQRRLADAAEGWIRWL